MSAHITDNHGHGESQIIEYAAEENKLGNLSCTLEQPLKFGVLNRSKNYTFQRSCSTSESILPGAFVAKSREISSKMTAMPGVACNESSVTLTNNTLKHRAL